MSSVKQRPNGRWRARWREPGGKQRARHFATEREANEWLITVAVDRRQGTYVDFRAAREWTVASWWAEWWPTAQSGLKESTADRDAWYWGRYIGPYLGHLRLDELDYLTLAKWITQLSAGGPDPEGAQTPRGPLSPSTVTKAHQVLRKELAGAVRALILATNPSDLVDNLPAIRVHEMRHLEPAEINLLANAAGDWSDFILTSSWCGLRFGEMAALTRSRVDLGRRLIRVQSGVVEVAGRTVIGTPKTAASIRSVPMPQVVVDALTARCKGLGPADYVFARADGGPLAIHNWRSRVWRPTVRRAGLEGLRIHDMRHTAVSLWIAAGADPRQVATWAGHSSVSTVLDRYGHLYAHREKAVMGALDELHSAAPASNVVPIGTQAKSS